MPTFACRLRESAPRMGFRQRITLSFCGLLLLSFIGCASAKSSLPSGMQARDSQSLPGESVIDEAPQPEAPTPEEPSQPDNEVAAGLIFSSASNDVNWHLEYGHTRLPKTTESQDTSDAPGLFDVVLSDHANFYSRDSLTKLGACFALGGVMANSSIDRGIQKHFQSSIRGASSDEWLEGLHANREMGNGRYTLPLFAAAWAGGRLLNDLPAAGPIGDWGERSLRAFLVGAPPMLAMQVVTGGSRPGETTSDSHWTPFQDNNGVSGHSFMGAIPFLSAAMMTEDPYLKTLFYAGSTLAPLSRINDEAHYPSQVLLGWCMAYFAARAVEKTGNIRRDWEIVPTADPNSVGLGIEQTW